MDSPEKIENEAQPIRLPLARSDRALTGCLALTILAISLPILVFFVVSPPRPSSIWGLIGTSAAVAAGWFFVATCSFTLVWCVATPTWMPRLFPQMSRLLLLSVCAVIAIATAYLLFGA